MEILEKVEGKLNGGYELYDRCSDTLELGRRGSSARDRGISVKGRHMNVIRVGTEARSPCRRNFKIFLRGSGVN